MRKKYFIAIILSASCLYSAFSFADDVIDNNKVREDAVLNSKMTKAVLRGLYEEQKLKCYIAVEESGKKSVYFYDENNTSKFRASYFCADMRSLIITGTIGDGHQTATEKIELVTAAN